MRDISFEGFIDDVGYGLSENNDNQKYCFILGAGASVKSGIDSGEMLVDRWEKLMKKRNPHEHKLWKESLEITEENQAEHYSDYYERYLEYNAERLKSELTKCIERGVPSVGYNALAYILMHGNSNIVITTNFDHLTEDAINQTRSIFPRVIGHESLADYIIINEKRPTIIKLHRDILFEPKNTKEQTKTLERNIKCKLPEIFKEYQPIFIGYAGNDESLMNFLSEKENLEKFKTGEWKKPIWTIYNQKPTEKQHEFLKNAGGFLVRSCSFDQVMIALGQRVGWKLPTRDAYLDTIRKSAENDYDRLEQQLRKYAQIDKIPAVDTKGGTTGKKKEIKPAKPSMTNYVVEITSNLKHDEKEKDYLRAIAEYNKKNYQEAARILKRIADKDKGDSRIFNGLSSAYDAMGNYTEAIKFGRIAINNEPNEPHYHNELAEVYYHNHDRVNGDKEMEIANRLRVNHYG